MTTTAHRRLTPRSSSRPSAPSSTPSAPRSSPTSASATRDYIRRVIKAQRGLEVAGRGAAAVRLPAAGLAGAAPPRSALSKILDNMEIGHNVMHGQYDWMGDPALNSQDVRVGHRCARRAVAALATTTCTTRYTNILGKDRDIGYGILRMDEDQKWHPYYLGNPVYAFAADAVLRVGRGAARPRGRAASSPASAPRGTTRKLLRGDLAARSAARRSRTTCCSRR